MWGVDKEERGCWEECSMHRQGGKEHWVNLSNLTVHHTIFYASLTVSQRQCKVPLQKIIIIFTTNPGMHKHVKSKPGLFSMHISWTHVLGMQSSSPFSQWCPDHPVKNNHKQKLNF